MPSNVEEFTWVTDHRLDVPDPDGAMTEKGLVLPKVHVGERFPLPHFRVHSARRA